MEQCIKFVYLLQGLPEIAACEDSIDLSPSNPFLDTCEKDKELEPTLQLLQVSYSFNNLTLFKNIPTELF